MTDILSFNENILRITILHPNKCHSIPCINEQFERVLLKFSVQQLLILQAYKIIREPIIRYPIQEKPPIAYDKLYSCILHTAQI